MSQAIRACTEFKPSLCVSRKPDITTSKEIMCEVLSFLSSETFEEMEDKDIEGSLKAARRVCKLWRKWSFDALKIQLRSRISLHLQKLPHYSARGIDVTRVGCDSLRMLEVNSYAGSLWNTDSFEALIRRAPRLESFQLYDIQLHHMKSIALRCPKLLSLFLHIPGSFRQHGEYEQGLLEIATSCRMMQSLHLKITDATCRDFDAMENPSAFSIHLDRIITAMPSLTSLSLEDINPIDINTMRAIGASRITHLAFIYCHMDSVYQDDTIHIPHFTKHMQKITHLDLALRDSVGYGVSMLMGFVRDLPQLISLQVSDAWFVGDQEIAGIVKHCPNLSVLGLPIEEGEPCRPDGGFPTIEGLRHLLQHLPKLTDLVLRNTRCRRDPGKPQQWTVQF